MARNVLISATMSRTYLVASLFLSAAATSTLLACQTHVIGGGSGGSGGTQPTGTVYSVTTGFGGSPGPTPTPAPSASAHPAEGGYVVTLANYPSGCGDNGIMPNCAANAWWNTKFQLRTTDVVVGTTLLLHDLSGFSTEELPGNPALSDCGYGAGTYSGDGTVTVVAASPTELTLTVGGTAADKFIEGGFDGTYTVPICATATPQNDGTAIAMKYGETPGSNNSSAAVGSGNGSCTGGGNFIDSETLMLFVSNLGQTCTDPYHASQGCIDSRYQLVLHIPVGQQTIGTFPLSGMDSVTIANPQNNPGGCSGGGGTYWDGTISITAISAASVTFTLAGTADIGSGFGSADGTYTAPRCF